MLELAGFWEIVMIPASVEAVCVQCFCNCQPLASDTFDSDWKFQQIETQAFAWSALRTIVIPGPVEVLCQFFFSFCKSLEPTTFESDSQLRRIDEFVDYLLPNSIHVGSGSEFANGLSVQFPSSAVHAKGELTNYSI
jgi:hypothetical protein